MATKITEFSKLLKKIEKKTREEDDDYMFEDFKEYKNYIRKNLKLTKKSDLYVIDQEEGEEADELYDIIMKYAGKDVSIQIGDTFAETFSGTCDIIVLIVTRN